MEHLIKKSKIQQKLNKYKKKVFELENQLYEIELKQSKFSYIDLLEQLT